MHRGRYLAGERERSKGPVDKDRPIRDGRRNLVQEVIYVSNANMRRSVASKLHNKDTKEVVDRCDSCQIHGLVSRLPKIKLTYIMSPWSFYQWGLDILGPLPEGPRKLKYIIVAIDYFTKWMEAKPLAKISAVAHPQANGLVERANKSLMHGLKERLGRERERVGWVGELLNILWAHRTMLKTSNDETPFSLTYGSEAVILAEIGMPTYRTIQWNEAQNEEEMRLNLDLIQERRETSAIREAKYKKKVEKYYN
ncbi:reverse transcriptase domain-containing protein [Tanacetum coccineum]